MRLSAEAADRKSGMTLDELAEFVRQAHALGCAGTDAVKAQVNMAGRVKELSLAPPVGERPVPPPSVPPPR
jgi:hypothetical protein